MHIQLPKPIDLDLGHELRQRSVDLGLLVAPRVLLAPKVQEGRDEGGCEAVFGPFGLEGWGVGARAACAGEPGECEFLGEVVEVRLGDRDLDGY